MSEANLLLSATVSAMHTADRLQDRCLFLYLQLVIGYRGMLEHYFCLHLAAHSCTAYTPICFQQF